MLKKDEVKPREWLRINMSAIIAREDFNDETLCPEGEDLQFIELSAYQDLEKQLADHKSALESINSRVDPGTCDSVDAMLEIVRENERLEKQLEAARAEVERLRARLKDIESAWVHVENCLRGMDTKHPLVRVKEALAKGEGE